MHGVQIRIRHFLILRSSESVKLDSHNLLAKKDQHTLPKYPYLVYEATDAKGDKMACLRSHLLSAKLGEKRRTSGLPVPIKVIILPVTLVQIWEDMWFFTMSHPQWPVDQKALWYLCFEHLLHLPFPLFSDCHQDVSGQHHPHTAPSTCQQMFSFLTLPALVNFPAWPALPTPTLSILLQFDLQVDAKIIFLKHPEHTLCLIQNWTESQKPSVPVTKVGSTEHWLQYIFCGKRGLLSWENTVCTLPYKSHSLLNQYFPKLFDYKIPFLQGTYTTTCQPQCLQKHTGGDSQP